MSRKEAIACFVPCTLGGTWSETKDLYVCRVTEQNTFSLDEYDV